MNTFRLPQTSALAAIILFGFVAVAHIVALPLVLSGAAHRMATGSGDAASALYALTILAAVAMTLPASIAWLVWSVRSRKNLDAMGAADLEYSTWFPWYFIAPGLNLFVPMLAIQEVWRKSVRPRSIEPNEPKVRNSKLIYLWWLAFIVYSLSGSLPGMIDSFGGTTYQAQFLPIYHSAGAVAAPLGAAVIWRVLQAQRRYAAPMAGSLAAATASIVSSG